MDKDTQSAKATRSTRAQGRNSASADRPEPTGPLVEFAAARAHELTDAVYSLVNDSIEEARRSATDSGIVSIVRRTQPLLLRAGAFVRDYPLRAGTIVALLACALWLTRTPTAQGS